MFEQLTQLQCTKCRAIWYLEGSGPNCPCCDDVKLVRDDPHVCVSLERFSDDPGSDFELSAIDLEEVIETPVTPNVPEDSFLEFELSLDRGDSEVAPEIEVVEEDTPELRQKQLEKELRAARRIRDEKIAAAQDECNKAEAAAYARRYGE